MSSFAVETNPFLVENNVPTIGKKNPQLMCNKHDPFWVGKLSPIMFAVGILTSVGRNIGKILTIFFLRVIDLLFPFILALLPHFLHIGAIVLTP